MGRPKDDRPSPEALRQRRIRECWSESRAERHREEQRSRARIYRGAGTPEDFHRLGRRFPGWRDGGDWDPDVALAEHPIADPKRDKPLHPIREERGSGSSGGSMEPGRAGAEEADRIVRGVTNAMIRRKNARPGPDGSLERAREFLAGGARKILAAAVRLKPHVALEQMFGACDLFDLAPKRRAKWAMLLEAKMGRAAVVMFLGLLVSVASDDGVRSVGAVVSHRLPLLCSADPKAALQGVDEKHEFFRR